MRPGADDNASGTAAVLALAKRFSQNPLPYSLLFLNFDAEEGGLNGSRAFTLVPAVNLDSVFLMLNLDMVGRLKDGPLEIEALGGADAFRAVWDSIAKKQGFPLKLRSSYQGRSDHVSFAKSGVPALHFYSGFHEDYHTAGDVAYKIDFAGLDRIVEFTEEVVRAARRPGKKK